MQKNIRVIPILLSDSEGSLVKTRKFKDPVYIGDPFNAVKIFNEKEVDELIYLDITASAQKRKPNISYISELASECFMPLCYGGGITTIDEIKAILKAGVEKISLNVSNFSNINLLREGADKFGSSAMVAAIDVKTNLFGKHYVYNHAEKKTTNHTPAEFAAYLAKNGAGEILLNSVDRDSAMEGYDTALIKSVSQAVNVPLIVCGGAGKIADFKTALDAGASALAAGSMFVFQGKHRAVLINYPTQDELMNLA